MDACISSRGPVQLYLIGKAGHLTWSRPLKIPLGVDQTQSEGASIILIRSLNPDLSLSLASSAQSDSLSLRSAADRVRDCHRGSARAFAGRCGSERDVN